MRQINMILAAAAAAVVAASCAKETAGIQSGHDNIPEGFKKVSFTTSVEDTKTTYKGGRVYWEASDKVSLFSGDANVKTELSIPEGKIAEDGSWANFEGLADEDASSYLAVYPSHADNAYDGQTLTVNIPTEQTAVEGGFDSGANVAVAWSEDNSLVFRNACALIGFKMFSADAANTASVKFRARKSVTEESTVYYGLSGASNIDFDSSLGLPAYAEGNVDYVLLNKPEGGFEGSKTYVVVVYPGEYEGFDLIFTDVEGKEHVRSNDMKCTLDRNSFLNIGLIQSVYDKLPDEVTVNIDFTVGQWPFEEKYANPGSSVTSVELTHTYSYSLNNHDFEIPMHFIWKRTSGQKSFSYSASSGFLNPGNTGNVLILPAVANRYLSTVTMGVKNTAASKKFKIVSSADSSVILATSSGAVMDEPVTVSLTTTEKDVSYGMLFSSGSTNIAYITLVYKKNR